VETRRDGLTGLHFFACVEGNVWASGEMAPLLRFLVARRWKSGIMDWIEHSSTGPWRLFPRYVWLAMSKHDGDWTSRMRRGGRLAGR
jgi:hypothetical protein